MAKILVAEDERDIRDLIAFTLHFAGHEVVSFTNGEEAWLAALQEKPDLILLDVRMPRMTGYEACQHLKADPATRHIPVVFLSATSQEREIQTGFEVGASEFFQKPFAPNDLTRKVNELLAGIGK